MITKSAGVFVGSLNALGGALHGYLNSDELTKKEEQVLKSH